jgi:hypothetical protein
MGRIRTAGFFSFRCRGCGHPMLSDGATNNINKWMTKVVALEKNGAKKIGEYDGYGRVEETNPEDFDDVSDSADWWHLACWRHSGKPGYKGPAKNARDQGWFFDDGAHDMPEPRSSSDVKDGQKQSESQDQAAKDAWNKAIKSSQKGEMNMDQKTRMEVAKTLVKLAKAINASEVGAAAKTKDDASETDKLLKQNPQLNAVARKLISFNLNMSDMFTSVLMAMKLKGEPMADINKAFSLLRPLLKKIV